MKELKFEGLYDSIRQLIIESRSRIFRTINTEIIQLYWEIGRLIVEDEQNGNPRANYGKQTIKELSSFLTYEFGRGYDESNLKNMRIFFRSFPIRDALRHELSWTHYRIISRVSNSEKRHRLMELAIEGNWNTRTLQRNIDSDYLGRILETKSIDNHTTTNAFIKDPYIFEFLGLPIDTSQTETTIESAIITHLQQFLMELGKGFSFVARQQHIVTDSSDFFIDLVFYNYFLKCFVIIDLKTVKLKHEHIGQMDMYVRMYNDLKKNEGDNPTIGIILCTEKDETVVKYCVLTENQRLFASRYRLYLPNENELKALIESDRQKFELDQV